MDEKQFEALILALVDIKHEIRDLRADLHHAEKRVKGSPYRKGIVVRTGR